MINVFCFVLYTIFEASFKKKKNQFEDRDIFGSHYTWWRPYIHLKAKYTSFNTNQPFPDQIVDKLAGGQLYLFEASLTYLRPALPIWGQPYLFEASFTYLRPALPIWGQPYLFEASFTYLRPALPIWGQLYLFEASLTYLRPDWWPWARCCPPELSRGWTRQSH